MSLDILDRFLQYFHYLALWVQMIDLDLVEGRCHGNQIMLGENYECGLISAFFALAFENELEYPVYM